MNITRRDVGHIAELADIGITQEEMEEFTHQFNVILDYFDLLDRLPMGEFRRGDAPDEFNILRDDTETPCLPQGEAIRNAPGREDGFIRAPRVM